jgi:excisionase family DNA binding protein
MQAEQPIAIDTKQVAALLSVSERHIRNLAARGVLKPFKLGGSTRFRREDVERYVREATAEPQTAA